MQKQSEKDKQQKNPGQKFNCEDCKDTGSLLHKVPAEMKYGEKLIAYEKDVYRPCHCREKKNLMNRFKNALIPDEFKKAKFDNFKRETDVQQTLYNATTNYLKELQSIIDNKADHNSLGFIAVMGETRMRGLDPESKAQAKKEHNSWGIGKTHLQMAAAKWIIGNIKIRDDIEMNANRANNLSSKSSVLRGCRVLCVSDEIFLNDLMSAKRMNDENKTFNDLMQGALKADVMVWDDLGKAKWTESKEEIYYRIINERYKSNKPIIFSSNEDKGTLSDKVGYAAFSRLTGMCGDNLYAVEGQDQR